MNRAISISEEHNQQCIRGKEPEVFQRNIASSVLEEQRQQCIRGTDPLVYQRNRASSVSEEHSQQCIRGAEPVEYQRTQPVVYQRNRASSVSEEKEPVVYQRKKDWKMDQQCTSGKGTRGEQMKKKRNWQCTRGKWVGSVPEERGPVVYAMVVGISHDIVFGICHVGCKGISYNHVVCFLAIQYDVDHLVGFLITMENFKSQK